MTTLCEYCWLREATEYLRVPAGDSGPPVFYRFNGFQGPHCTPCVDFLAEILPVEREPLL